MCEHPDPGDYKPGEEIPRLPYESIYLRCMCGAHGFTPETWKEIGSMVITSGGKHWHPKALHPCAPYPQLTGDDSLISERLWNLEKKP